MLRRLRIICLLSLVFYSFPMPQSARAAAAIYYVSSSGGNDANNGLSAAAPFQTIAKVNTLTLQPGDQVLFKCGDTWQAEILHLTRSGTAGNPITFSSYPSPTCTDQPTLSGTRPITGWTVYSGNIYRANVLNAPNGINQLFRNGVRLGLGRWPNRGTADGGYATIDAHSSAQITENSLPAGNWVSATAHIKGMRWYIINRTVNSSSGPALNLNTAPDCWGGSCVGWGFWLSNHLLTLDQEGEWYYQPATQQVYLYSATDPNTASLAGSVVFADPSANAGAVVLGRHLQQHLQHVVVENFAIVGWFQHGISTPVNLEKDENASLTLRRNTIRDVDGIGLNLATWVWNAAANGNGYNGWRGGYNLTVEDNVIDGANHMGINTYARQSVFQRNTVRNIALINALGASGMGCGTTSSGGFCTEYGDGVRIKIDSDGTYSGNHVTFQDNRLENIGHNGIDVFGYNNTLSGNVIVRACSSKGDCGAVRSFGTGNIATTVMRNLTLANNIIVEPIGNTDGCQTAYDPLFGFGLYIDYYSRDVTLSGNTVISATAAGILYQDSTGSAQNNTLFNNAAYQISVINPPNALAAITGNVFVGLQANAGTLVIGNASQVTTANYNQFAHATRTTHISAQGNKTLAQWRTYSGQDAQSTELISATLTTAEIFYNPTNATASIELLRPYVTLTGTAVSSPLVLAPYASRVLIPNGPLAPQLRVVKSAPGGVASGTPITYTLVASNRAGITATNVVLTDTLPTNVAHLSGGTLVGNVVSWSVPSLAVSSTFTVTFSVMPSTTLPVINADYALSAAGGYRATSTAVVTLIDPLQVYLPIVRR